MGTKLNSYQEFPLSDDGWWASVLAEEESSLPLQQSVPRQEPARKAVAPNWERALQIYRQDEIVVLPVIGYNRGGLLVGEGDLSGFVPCSHLVDFLPQTDEAQRQECFAKYVGRKLRLKIIECVAEKERIVFSERAARAGSGKRLQMLDSLKPGQRVQGEVTNITDFGVFVDLGGVEGLIHLSELSWGRVIHPGDVLTLGQQVETLVLDISPERCRIALSLKRLQENPWKTVEARYPLNSITSATITTIVPFGVFARLEEGVEGLVHNSEIPLPAGATPADYLSPGQTIQVRVIHVDASRQRLSLSMKLIT